MCYNRGVAVKEVALHLVDPIPEEFASYEEAAEFWDTHDTTDYPDAFRTVDVVAEFKRRYYEVEIEWNSKFNSQRRTRETSVEP
jgi:hypothetical protein